MASLLRLGALRLSGGAAKPKWTVDRSQFLGPARGDKHHYGEHATFNYFLLFIRGLRPHVEEAAASAASLVGAAVRAVAAPTRAFVAKHNPDLRLQLVALASFTGTSMLITSSFNEKYQRIIDMTSLLEHRAAAEYASEGFWRSKEEEVQQRQQQLQQQQQRLESCWARALAAATPTRSFDVLCLFLDTPTKSSTLKGDRGSESEEEQTIPILPQVPWRFDLMPYGADNPDTKTFPVPDHEMPLRAFSLSFTSNNLSGNWGDYVNRQDNKNAIMRPSRMMFTDAFIPPTK